MGMRIFDADIVIDYLHGLGAAADFFDSIAMRDRYFTDIAYMEILAGAHNRHDLQAIVHSLTRMFDRVLPGTERSSRTAREIYRTHVLSCGLDKYDALIAGI